MGYFNYFIKCVIRKFVNIIFKPKMFLALLIIIGLLFAMNITARAEWTDEQITDLQADLFDIIFQLTQQVADLEQIRLNTEAEVARLEWINGQVTTIKDTIVSLNTTTQDIQSKIYDITKQLTTLNTEILNIYNALEENQQELLSELEKDNQAVLEELNMIREAINGTEEEESTYIDLGVINGLPSGHHSSLKGIMINYEPKYSYKIKVHLSTSTYSSYFHIGLFDNPISNGYDFNSYITQFINLGSFSAEQDITFTYNVPSSNPKYIYFTYAPFITKIEVLRSIKGITESLNQSNDLQQEQNQLQQESNQLQQEQNDLIKDDNVNTDGLEFATDDTVNPTSDGFDTLFNTIYNAFCNTSSEPLTITLPFINKTFTIQPNIVSNGMQKAGLGVIVTLINSFYYFSVCLFIYKDIGKIIDNLKSGNITSDCGNVKTEVL